MTPEELDAIEARVAAEWPPLKLAIWHVVTGAELNANYVSAQDITAKIFAAVSAENEALVAGARRLREAIEQSTCPHPISGDETVRDCVNHGHCGCGNLAALKGDVFAIKFHQERMGAQS